MKYGEEEGATSPTQQEQAPPSGRNVASSAPAFMVGGWLYPAGLNRKQRRLAQFGGRDTPEVHELGGVYVGNKVMEGPILDEDLVTTLLAERVHTPPPAMCEDDDEGMPPPLDAPSSDDEAYAHDQGRAGSSTPGATASNEEADSGASGVAFQAPHAPQCDAPPEAEDDTSDLDSQSFLVGDRVIVARRQGQQQIGTVAYVGFPEFSMNRGPRFDGEWIGVVLDIPDGNHDGIVDGVRYFYAEANQGVFVRRDNLIGVACGAGLTPTRRAPAPNVINSEVVHRDPTIDLRTLAGRSGGLPLSTLTPPQQRDVGPMGYDTILSMPLGSPHVMQQPVLCGSSPTVQQVRYGGMHSPPGMTRVIKVIRCGQAGGATGMLNGVPCGLATDLHSRFLAAGLKP